MTSTSPKVVIASSALEKLDLPLSHDYSVIRGWIAQDPAIYLDVSVVVAAGDAPLATELRYILPTFRLVVCATRGYDAIDVDQLEAAGIAFSHTENVNEQDVADHALGAMIMHRRALLEGDRVVRGGRWEQVAELRNRSFSGNGGRHHFSPQRRRRPCVEGKRAGRPLGACRPETVARIVLERTAAPLRRHRDAAIGFHFQDEGKPIVFDLARYLERIKLPVASVADGQTLDRLQFAHRQHIPFENIDVKLGRPVSIDGAAVFEKLVTRARGGYCFEQNQLFLDALTALGFSARTLLARVWLGAKDMPPQTHSLILVTIDDELWIADAGFGGSYVPPIRLIDKLGVRVARSVLPLSDMPMCLARLLQHGFLLRAE